MYTEENYSLHESDTENEINTGIFRDYEHCRGKGNDKDDEITRTAVSYTEKQL